MTRAEAMAILAEREGMPPEQVESQPDETVIAAALAPSGQPCADCGKLVQWRESGDYADWFHVDTPTRCFLARQDER